MIKKIYCKYYSDRQSYFFFAGAESTHCELGYLWGYLYFTDSDCQPAKDEDENNIYFYDPSLIKWPNHRDPEFITGTDAQYCEYEVRRKKDIPTLKITKINFAEIEKKWKQVLIDKPTYIIFSQDESGYIDLVGKEELSPEDVHDMEYNYQQFLRYEKARRAYEIENYGQSKYWRSPADEEYEADWQKYLDKPVKKIEDCDFPTREEAGRELKEKVKNKENIRVIGQWANLLAISNLAYIDEDLQEFFLRLSYIVEDSPYYLLSYEELDKLADRLIAGEKKIALYPWIKPLYDEK